MVPLLYEPLFVGLETLLELLLLGLVTLALLFVLLGFVTVVLLLLLGLVTVVLLPLFGEVSTLVPVPLFVLLLGRTEVCTLSCFLAGVPFPPTTPPPTDGLWVVAGLIISPPGVVVGLHLP